MAAKPLIEPVCSLRHTKNAILDSKASRFTLRNNNTESCLAEIILDYKQCEGGIPVFEVASALGDIPISIAVVYSEGVEGIEHSTGDGPFFLFSNAMDTYRSTTMTVPISTSAQTIRAVYAQRSQRYQKVVLLTPNSSITFSKVGFEQIRPSYPAKSTFTCSNPLLSQIWRDGVKTVDMCTVAKGETSAAWDVTSEGTRVRGQHWAPCRVGTRWADKKVRFEVKIENGGASWAVHMVANGLIFCLDMSERVLYACEGLSTESTIFPVAEKGRWSIGDLDIRSWFEVETVTQDDSVTVFIQGRQIAIIEKLDIRPILGGSANNTGSVAFGGPCQWVALYRHLNIYGSDGRCLYENTLLLDEQLRTLADFQVGTNALACTIDGAKRDRACFGGDLYVMGRSIAYSTMTFDAVAGSIELLASHQTEDGYLGNLCPIQAPAHDGEDEPPTYAFYSLAYALLFVVAIKDYWLHTGDEQARSRCLQPIKKLLAYTERFTDQGIVIAPPPLSMHWFPLGGPVFGASSALNNAYYEALQATSVLADDDATKEKYFLQAHNLKARMIGHFYDPSTGIYHLDKSLPSSGVCQDVKAHALTLDLIPHHTNDIEQLTDPSSELPRAFRGLGHWDIAQVASPYASGYAVEALFTRERGAEAVKLIERVWGPMADTTSANYSGGHWEAMKLDGTPHGHDTSLMHGWSTWPVSLLPQYLAGLQPLEPGWKSFSVAPVLAGLTAIQCTLYTAVGHVGVKISIDEANGEGTLELLAPCGVRVRLQAPRGWTIHGSVSTEGTGVWQSYSMSETPGDQKLDTKAVLMQTTARSETRNQAQPRQHSTLTSKIRSLFSKFVAIPA